MNDSSTYKSRSDSWSEEEELKLVELWGKALRGKKLTVSQVSSLIPGRSRNAIVGKVHRMKKQGHDLDIRPSPIRTIRGEKTNLPNIDIIDTGTTAQVGKSDRFCEDPDCFAEKAQRSYCDYHAKLYYVKPDKKKEPWK